jgi:hypothetical protein
MQAALQTPCQVEKMTEIRHFWMGGWNGADSRMPSVSAFHQSLVCEFGRYARFRAALPAARLFG